MARNLEIVVASNHALRDAVYLFRQEISDRAPVDLLRPARAVGVGLQDALDSTAVIVAALDKNSGRMVGAARTNQLSAGPIPVYPELYGLQELPSTRRLCCSVTTCWTFAPGVQHLEHGEPSDVAVGLASTLFNIALRDRVCHDFTDCPDAQVPFFLKLGYRRQERIDHPSRGPSNLMRLDIYDWQHLAKVKSPLLALTHETTV